MKNIDKYVFNQDESFTQDGIASYMATHSVLKKKYLVKKLIVSSDSQKESSNYLTRECQILKKISHESVYRCYKLLRSKNNFYAIYDWLQGKSLTELLRGQVSFSDKASIFKQLIQLLFAIQSRNITSLSFNPGNIVIREKCKIVMKNFGMAEEFAKEDKQKIVEGAGVMDGEYMPPEIRENKVYRNSDLYSFGELIRRLFAHELENMDHFKQRVGIILEQHGINVSLSMQNIKSMVEDLTKESSRERADLKELLTAKMNYLTVTPHLSQPTQKRLNISRSTSHLSNPDQKHRLKIENFDRLLQVIHKKRGITLLILKLSQAVLVNKQAELSQILELSFMLVKKATIIISQLAKLLSIGMNSQYLIEQQHLQIFQKEQTFKKYLNQINKEMNETRQKFQYMLHQIMKIEQLSHNEYLQHQTKNESVNEAYLKKVVLEFLLELNLIYNDDYVSRFHNDSLYYVYVLSLLADFKYLEEIYDSFFLGHAMQIKDQPLFKQLSALGKVKVVQLIQRNTSRLYSQTSGSFELSVKTTKSGKTLKSKSFE